MSTSPHPHGPPQGQGTDGKANHRVPAAFEPTLTGVPPVTKS
ncbi:hypothetical protein [Kitasatospora putterlickiae]